MTACVCALVRPAPRCVGGVDCFWGLAHTTLCTAGFNRLVCRLVIFKVPVCVCMWVCAYCMCIQSWVFPVNAF